MKSIFIFLFFILMSITVFSQGTNLTPAAQYFWDNAKSLFLKAQNREDHLNVIKEFEKVKSLCPDFPDTYYNLACLYLEVADKSTDYYSKAARSIEKYAFLVPDDDNIQDLANNISAKIKENGISGVSINLSSSAKTYRLGDVFYAAGSKGVVCNVDENGLHGFAVSIEESTGDYNSAVRWIAQNFTGRWNMPNEYHMNKILDNIHTLQVFLVRNNCDLKKERWYWTSDKTYYRTSDGTRSEGKVVFLLYPYKDSCDKILDCGKYGGGIANSNYVRAIYEF